MLDAGNHPNRARPSSQSGLEPAFFLCKALSIVLAPGLRRISSMPLSHGALVGAGHKPVDSALCRNNVQRATRSFAPETHPPNDIQQANIHQDRKDPRARMKTLLL